MPLRSLTPGMLGPGGRVAIDITPPLGEDEAPIVLTRDPRDLRLTSPNPGSVIVSNLTRRQVAYAVLVVSKTMMAMARNSPEATFAHAKAALGNYAKGLIDRLLGGGR